jgi:hypothetical protein
VTKNGMSQVEQLFNRMSNHANQPTQRQPVFGNKHGRMVQANGNALAVSDVWVEYNKRQTDQQ